MLALTAGVLALAGCAPEYDDYAYAVSDAAVAAPRKPAGRRMPASLLTPERKPDCEPDAAMAQKAPPARVAQREREDGAATAAGMTYAQQPPAADAELALRIRLEYERECYKQAEGRVRARLQKLQAWTAETIKAPAR